MALELESARDFDATLEEVEVLIASAEATNSDETKYSTFCKASILLLAAKFENFVESIAEEYVYLINNLQIHSNLIPDNLKLHHSFQTLRDFENIRVGNKHAEAVMILNELSSLWGTGNSVSLKINCKFSYGKHGGKELKKLFASIGIEDIFEEVKIYSFVETLSDDELDKVEIDFKGDFNSLTGIRNHIIHQDGSPNLTIEMIKGYKSTFQTFSQELANYLKNNLIELQKLSGSLPNDGS